MRGQERGRREDAKQKYIKSFSLIIFLKSFRKQNKRKKQFGKMPNNRV